MSSPTSVEPAAFPPELSHAIIPLFGAIVYNWSVAEHALVNMVAVIYQSAGGKTVEKEIPQKSKRIFKFLRRCFKTIPALEPYRDEGLRIVDGISKHAEMRHAIVHGVIDGFDPSIFAIRMVKIDVDIPADIHIARERWFGLGDMALAGEELGKLSLDAIVLCRSLIQAFVPD